MIEPFHVWNSKYFHGQHPYSTIDPDDHVGDDFVPEPDAPACTRKKSRQLTLREALIRSRWA
jgi:hypothetical protein